MSGEYQSKLQEALHANNDNFSRDNVHIVLAKCGALLHDVDDQLEKIEAGNWSGYPLCWFMWHCDYNTPAFLFSVGTNYISVIISVYNGKAKWLVGENMCTADVVLTVFVYRLWVLGFSKTLFENKLPRIDRYFKHTKANMPGFSDVCRNFRSIE